ncbi:MAG TPA: YceI family protein [Azonexus sp.]|nr:YceI family protein [Azonexus sp.]
MPFKALLIACFASLAFPAAALEYAIDPEHTYASFEIDHLGFSTQRGQFTRSSGTLDFDPEAHSGKVYIRIAAASLTTGLEARDEVLRGADWFNVRDFPDLLFRSQRFVFKEDKLVAVEGTLVMLGVIKPLRLEISRFKCGLNLASRKQVCGADAQGSLRRSEFGLSNGLPFVGDEVRLHIQVEAHLP